MVSHLQREKDQVLKTTVIGREYSSSQPSSSGILGLTGWDAEAAAAVSKLARTLDSHTGREAEFAPRHF